MRAPTRYPSRGFDLELWQNAKNQLCRNMPSCAVQLMGDNKALMVGYLQREPGLSSKFIVLQINTKVVAGLGKYATRKCTT